MSATLASLEARVVHLLITLGNNGCLDGSPIATMNCIGGMDVGLVQLTPVGNAAGMNLLVLPIDANSTVIVEERRAIDYDRGLQKEGPLFYLIDIQIKNGEVVLKVLPINANDRYKRDAPLSTFRFAL